MSEVPSLNPWFPPLPAGAPPPKPLRAVGIVGIDKIATGIAHLLATKGMGVMMHDREAGALSQSVDVVRGLFRNAEGRGEITPAAAHKAMGGISITTGLEDLEFCDIVIETVIEDAAAKRARFADFGRVLPKDCLLATCASAAGLAEFGTTVTAPERLIGLCFFDPVGETGHVQINLSTGTSRATAERVVAFVIALGKRPIIQGPARPSV